jgi:hypothetical protein
MFHGGSSRCSHGNAKGPCSAWSPINLARLTKHLVFKSLDCSKESIQHTGRERIRRVSISLSISIIVFFFPRLQVAVDFRKIISSGYTRLNSKETIPTGSVLLLDASLDDVRELELVASGGRQYQGADVCGKENEGASRLARTHHYEYATTNPANFPGIAVGKLSTETC